MILFTVCVPQLSAVRLLSVSLKQYGNVLVGIISFSINHVPSGSSLFLVFIVLELLLPKACLEPECTNYYAMTYCIYIVSFGHFIYVLTYCHKYKLHICIHAVGTYLQHLSTAVQV